MYWYEVCDATQNEKYLIDRVQVSNFVLPLYFTPGEETGSKNDFLRATERVSRALPSFGLAPGGYAGYYDPLTNSDQYVFADNRARERQDIKKMRGPLGRGARYAAKSPSPGK